MGEKRRRVRSSFSVILVVVLLITTIFPGPSATLYAAEMEKNENTQSRQTKQQIAKDKKTALAAEHESPAQLTENEEFSVEVSNENATTMTLHYKSDDTTKDMEMERLEDGTFTATIPGSDVKPKTLEYRFAAETADNEIKTSLPYIVDVVKDTTKENTKDKENQDSQEDETQPSEKSSEPSTNDTETPEDKTTETAESDTNDETETDVESENDEQQEAFAIEHSPITE